MTDFKRVFLDTAPLVYLLDGDTPYTAAMEYIISYLHENDVEIINYLHEKNIPLLILFTKADKINQKEKSALLKHIKEVGVDDDYFFVSSLTKANLDKVKGYIESKVK